MEICEKNHYFWAFFSFGTSTKQCGTDTKQCGTGTTCVLVDWYRYQKVGIGTQCFVLDHH